MKLADSRRRAENRYAVAVSAVLGLILCLAVYGAIPFVSTESIGQMLWTSGFAQSFANGGWLAIHASDFGLPGRAPMAFGLAGGWLESIILRLLPLEPVDAYSLMVDIYLALAYWGAARLASRNGISGALCFAAATVWICLPMVWAHAEYSMLSLGFALLPLYLLSAIRVVDVAGDGPWRQWAVPAAGFVAMAILAVFMDGYTFMFFAVAAMLYGGAALVFAGAGRRYRRLMAALVLASGFVLATGLYMAYERAQHFDSSPIGFFRAYGVDITMLVKPDRGTIWLWDVLGLSVPHDGSHMFGDASVWNTTFCLPLLFAAVVGWWGTRGQWRSAFFLATIVVGVYFGLGPSLKIASIKPIAEMANLMDAKYAIAPTGTAWISEHVPGFDNLRAAYRWVSLALLGMWSLLTILLASIQRAKKEWVAHAIVVAVLLTVCLPNIEGRIASGKVGRQAFFAIKRDFADPLGQTLKGHHLVAFLPRGNDFLANYLAAFYSYGSLNIGGDKNVGIAWRQWSQGFKDLTSSEESRYFVDGVRGLLARGEVDAIVFPYVDLLRHAHTWPPTSAEVDSFRERAQSWLGCLRSDGDFQLTETRLYSVLALSQTGKASVARGTTPQWLSEKPICPRVAPFAWPDLNSPLFGHQVGRLDIPTGQFVSDHREGFLVFGPYAALPPGNYIVELSGKLMGSKGKLDVDVVANDAKLTLAKASRDDIAEGGRYLLRIPFRVERDMRHIETRVWVSAETGLSLSALKVFPVNDQVAVDLN